MEQRIDRKTSNSMGMVWKLNPPEVIGKRLVTCCRKAIDALLGNISDTEDALSAAMCIADQTLHAMRLTSVN